MKKLLVFLLTACFVSVGFAQFGQNADIAGETGHEKLFAGTIYYVDASAPNDANDGTTPNKPKKTIGAGIALLSVGDALTIKSGTYTEVGLDLNVDACELWFEIGVVIDPVSGTALILSGNYCKLTGMHTISPGAGEIGLLISGNYCHVEHGRILAGGTGVQITGAGCMLERYASGNQTAIAYDIKGIQTRLRTCSTVGVGATYGYKINNNVDTGVLENCTSVGHQTSGFHIGTGSQDWTILNCSSGSGDGRWVDTDNANVWSDFSYSNELFKEIDMVDATQAFGLFTVTGTIEIEFIHGHIEEASNAELGNCLFRVYSSGGIVNLTTATDCENLSIGSFIGKTADASNALTVQSSATPGIVENTNFRDPKVSTIIVADSDQTTTIQFYSNDSVGNKDGKFHFHVKYRPISDDGFLEAI